MTREELKTKAHSLPLQPGVYIMMDVTGQVIYVGKAKALKNRVSQYFQDSSAHNEKTRAMVSQIDHFDVILAGSEFEALVLECSLIKRHRPRYNILLKDDKGYPYVRLSAEEYPRFSLANRREEDGAEYFGPFGSRGATKNMLEAVSSALRLPICGRKFPRDIGRERPCLNWDMNRCQGWCLPEHTSEEYRCRINEARQILDGKFSQLETELTAAMEAAAEELRFEEAAQLRDRLQAIRLLSSRQKVISGLLADTDVCGLYQGEAKSCFAVLHFQAGELAARDIDIFPTPLEELSELLSALVKQYYGNRGHLPRTILLPRDFDDRADVERLLCQNAGHRVDLAIPQRGDKVKLIRMAENNAADEVRRATSQEERRSKLMTLLGNTLGLKGLPHRIEAYDISNTGSSDIVAAMTVFLDGRPLKRDYRCFKLKDMIAPDDYAAMKQVLTRRFRRYLDGSRGFEEKPDLLLMDGGLGQVHAAQEALGELGLSLPVFGMVKDDRHRTRGLVGPDGREVGLSGTHLFALIGRIQEETHNTAISFHRSQHADHSRASQLDAIPGVGQARKAALLKHFKSIKAIRAASLEELAAAVPRNTAAAVYQYYHGTGYNTPPTP